MPFAIKTFDWASTPLGPMENWPHNLLTLVEICEHADYAVAILWGPEWRLIYNEAFARGPGLMRPDSQGVPAHEMFRHIWDTLEPQLREVAATGAGYTAPEQRLVTIRDGVEEISSWSYTLTPVYEQGTIAGIFTTGFEITHSVLADRRLAFQIALTDRLRDLADPEAMQQVATELLGQHLGAMRVGYADLDREARTLTVRKEWTRDPSVTSMAGHILSFDMLGIDGASFCQAPETIVVTDEPTLQLPGKRHIKLMKGVRSSIIAPMIREGQLRSILYVQESDLRKWRPGEVGIVRDAAERTGSEVERALAEKSLRESEDHYRHTVEFNPQVTWTSLPNGQVNRIASRWQEWTGASGLGDSWLNNIHPDDKERSSEAWRDSIASGEAYDIEHRIKRRDGSYRWARSRAFPRHDEKGNIILWYGATEDVHEQKMAEELQRLLINELNHRVKNTLSAVQAIAFQTLKGDIPLEEARLQFESRLLALSSAHNLLTERSWEGALMAHVVTSAIEHLAADQSRFTISGDMIWLAPRAALAFSLALHELATNAAKYGALSQENGSISVTWSIEKDRLHFIWKEKGGPKVTKPSRRGFGSRLIEMGLTADLRGEAKLKFEPDGLCCTIDALLEAIQAREDEFD